MASVAAAALVGVVPAGPAAATAPSAPAAPSAVAWGPCAAEELVAIPAAERFRYGCATHPVPLDHARPERGTIDLALMRRAAGDPDARIGTLFLNPGGPGGSGVTFMRTAPARFAPEVLDRFDLVGFDPRGVARSAPLRCFPSQEAADAVLGRVSALPLTREQERGTAAAIADYADHCARHAGPLLGHMSTEAVARDLDVLRAAVGDRALTYVGFSYGTLVGATYVNLFPERTRAVVLDGNVDPRLRLTDGREYDRQRTEGFELALDAFLAACDDAGPACAFSGGDPRARFDETRELLGRRGPVTLPTGDVVDLETFVGVSGGAMYQPGTFPQFAAFLQAVHAATHPGVHAQVDLPEAAVDALLANQALARRDAPYLDDDSYTAVNCTDKPFDNRLRDAPRIADAWDRSMPTFGRFLAWGDTAFCPVWPPERPDRYTGPWDRRTPDPVLVIGNRHDPATRHAFAERMAAELGHARLVGVDAFGHCILGGNTCADRVTTEYLLTLRVPAPGLLCPPDGPVFPVSPPGSARSAPGR